MGRDRYDRQLDRILSAATGVIARDGYERASMRRIASAAGVSLAGLYHYFENKEHLLFLIQFRAFSALLMEVQSRLSGVEDPSEQLRALIRTHVGYVAHGMATLKVCSHELDSLSGRGYERVWRVRREYYEVARAVVTRLIEKHAPGSGLDPRVATMSLFGTLNWLYRWYDPSRDRSPSSLANQIFSQFLAGLLGATRDGRRNGGPNGSPERRNGGIRASRRRSPLDNRKEPSRASSRHRAARAG